jgi:hypothetical protein
VTPAPGAQNASSALIGNLTALRMALSNQTLMGLNSLGNLTNVAGSLDSTRFNRTGPLVAAAAGAGTSNGTGAVEGGGEATTPALPPAAGPPKFQF